MKTMTIPIELLLMSSMKARIIISQPIGVYNMLSTRKCVYDRFCVMVSIVLDID